MRRGKAVSGEKRFDEKIIKTEDGCWLWAAAVDRDGYATFTHRGRKVGAHRYSYERFVGPIPRGLYVDHLCRQRSCVNPDHLRAVTPRQNATENSNGPSAVNAAKTHCMYGHEFSDENTYRYPAGQRACRICLRRGWNLADSKRKVSAYG